MDDALSRQVPLCVDLDGTLVKSDTLADSLLVLARQNPRALYLMPGWLLKGKAAFKQRLTEAVNIDVSTLPYNKSLLDYLAQQGAAGRLIFLATAADQKLAKRVALHLGIFHGVIASDGLLNLKGEDKLRAFQNHFGDYFSYVGNSKPDLPILASCMDPMVANPSAALMSGLRLAGIVPSKVFCDSVPELVAWRQAVQPHQWAKNSLVFLPLLLGQVWKWPGLVAPIVAALLGFFSFGLLTSATLILVDLLGLEADRRDPSRRLRPFAAGNLSAMWGACVVTCCCLSSVILALIASRAVIGFRTSLADSYSMLWWLSLYGLGSFAYLVALRRIPVVKTVFGGILYLVPLIASGGMIGLHLRSPLALPR